MYFRLQNLNEKADGTCGLMLRHGRCWWRPWWDKNQAHRGVQFYFSWLFWTHFFHVGIEFGGNDEDDITFRFACGLFAVWLTIGNLGWKWLPQERECEISYHDAALWVMPWSKSMEWCKVDPWWVRGLTIHMPWDWVYVRHQVMRPNRTFVNAIDPWRLKPRADGAYGLESVIESDGREVWIVPYRYTLKSGEVQRTATMHAEERE